MNANFQKAIADQQRDDARESEAHRTLFKKNRKIKLAGELALICGVAAIVGLAVYNPFSESIPFGDGPEQVTAGAPTTDYVAPEWYQEADNRFPLDLATWQQAPHTSQDQKVLAETVLSAPGSYLVTLYAKVLPSASTGYVDQAGAAFRGDGSKNPRYSLWTEENFSSSLMVSVERLINPTFGDWVDESRTNDLAAIETKLADLFTGDFLLSEAALPVVTDSTPVDVFAMGGGLPANGTGWTGRVSGEWVIELIYDEAAQNYTATVKVPVVYAIWKADRTIVTTGALLELSVVPNHEAKGQTDRVLIDSATLSIGG